MRDKIEKAAQGIRCGVTTKMIGEWLESQGWDVKWEVHKTTVGGHTRCSGNGSRLRSREKIGERRDITEVSFDATKGDEFIWHTFGADTIRDTARKAIENN